MVVQFLDCYYSAYGVQSAHPLCLILDLNYFYFIVWPSRHSRHSGECLCSHEMASSRITILLFTIPGCWPEHSGRCPVNFTSPFTPILVVLCVAVAPCWPNSSGWAVMLSTYKRANGVQSVYHALVSSLDYICSAWMNPTQSLHLQFPGVGYVPHIVNRSLKNKIDRPETNTKHGKKVWTYCVPRHTTRFGPSGLIRCAASDCSCVLLPVTYILHGGEKLPIDQWESRASLNGTNQPEHLPEVSILLITKLQMA